VYSASLPFLLKYDLKNPGFVPPLTSLYPFFNAKSDASNGFGPVPYNAFTAAIGPQPESPSGGRNPGRGQRGANAGHSALRYIRVWL